MPRDWGSSPSRASTSPGARQREHEYRGTPYADADHDGLADEWEKEHGLDPRNPADASADLNSNGYTNIEEFINGTDPRARH